MPNHFRAIVAASVAAAPSLAHAERIEVGGYAGGTSTTMHQRFACDPPTSPDDVCVSSAAPHDGAHGVSLGGYVRYPVFRPLLVEADLTYAQKGYGGSDVRMHYLEAPILVRVDPYGAWSHARAFGYGGLAPALHLGCHASGMRWDNDTNMAVPYSDPCGQWPFYPRAPNRFDLGLVIGGGIGWESSFGVFELHARYIEGLLDNGTWDGGTTVNRALYVFAGFGRALGKH